MLPAMRSGAAARHAEASHRRGALTASSRHLPHGSALHLAAAPLVACAVAAAAAWCRALVRRATTRTDAPTRHTHPGHGPECCCVQAAEAAAKVLGDAQLKLDFPMCVCMLLCLPLPSHSCCARTCSSPLQKNGGQVAGPPAAVVVVATMSLCSSLAGTFYRLRHVIIMSGSGIDRRAAWHCILELEKGWVELG